MHLPLPLRASRAASATAPLVLAVLLPLAAAFVPLLRADDTCPLLLGHDKPMQPSERPLSTRVSAPHPRIVGGRRTEPRLAAHMAFVQGTVDGRTVSCTGAIVSDTAVLTTAKCASKTLEDTRVAISGISSVGLDMVSVDKVLLHRSFEAGSGLHPADVALIILSKRIPPRSKKMALNSNKHMPVTRSAVRMLGYGILNKSDDGQQKEPNDAGFLYQVDLPTIRFADCNGLPTYSSSLSLSSHFCAGYLKRDGCGACDGDLGAPLVQYTAAGQPVLIGLAVGPGTCGKKEDPIAALRIEPLLPWITESGVAVSLLSDAQQVDAGVEPDPDSGLSTGAMVGIGVAVAVVLLSVALIACLCIRRCGKKNKIIDDEKLSQTDPSNWSHNPAASGPAARPPAPPSPAHSAAPNAGSPASVPPPSQSDSGQPSSQTSLPPPPPAGMPAGYPPPRWNVPDHPAQPAGSAPPPPGWDAPAGWGTGA